MECINIDYVGLYPDGGVPSHSPGISPTSPPTQGFKTQVRSVRSYGGPSLKIVFFWSGTNDKSNCSVSQIQSQKGVLPLSPSISPTSPTTQGFKTLERLVRSSYLKKDFI